MVPHLRVPAAPPPAAAVRAPALPPPGSPGPVPMRLRGGARPGTQRWASWVPQSEERLEAPRPWGRGAEGPVTRTPSVPCGAGDTSCRFAAGERETSGRDGWGCSLPRRSCRGLRRDPGDSRRDSGVCLLRDRRRSASAGGAGGRRGPRGE